MSYMLIREETRLKNQGIHSIHFVSHQRAGKKHAKGKQRSLKINESSAKIHKKEHNDDKCHFCGKLGYFQKDCLKLKAWFEKKGKPSSLICFESNLAKVIYSTWGIDFGCTTHVSNTMHRFLTTQIINPPNKTFVFIGNKVKASI